MQAPDARWFTIAVTLALACTRSPALVPELRAEPSVPEPRREAAAPPALAAAAPAAMPRPGKLTRLSIGEGWGCVIDEVGELWCWGHGPAPAPAWQAVRVETPGPVLALASDQESGSPARHVTCATFKDADALCWEHSALGSSERWGPFAGTAGAVDIAVHAQSSGTGSNFVCMRMPDDTAPCYLYFAEHAPEQTLRGIIDLEHVGILKTCIATC